MKFVIKKTSNGQFRFTLVASNGQIVATSETYTRKAGVVQIGIRAELAGTLRQLLQRFDAGQRIPL